jgi:Apea-like HEPN
MNITIQKKEKDRVIQVFKNIKDLIQETQKNPSTIFWDMDDYGKSILAPIFKIEDIKKNFDPEIIIQLIDIAFSNAESNSAAKTADVFVSLFSHVSDQWIGFFPLAFSNLFAFYRKTRRGKVSFSNCEIIDSFGDIKKLEIYLNKQSCKALENEIVAHQSRSTKETILKYPLLKIPLSGSASIANWNGVYYFRVFRRLLDFYLVYFDKSVRLRDIRQDPARMFVILNVKTGEFTRHNLMFDGDEILGAWNKKEFRLFLANKFDEFYQFLLGKSELRARLLRFLDFFSRSFNEKDNTMKLLTAVIAMEALFSKSNDSPIKSTLAESSAALIKQDSEKIKVYDLVRKCYDVRSKIVHSGAFEIEYGDIKEVRMVFSKVAFEAMKLMLNITKENGGEKDYFAAILKMKIGLAN